MASRLSRTLARLSPSTVLGIAWLWLAIYAFPGQMAPDSYEHVLEGRAGVYTDGHPPMIAILFKIGDALVAGGLVMWTLSSVLFLWALYLVFSRTFTPRRAAWITAAVFVFPPVMIPFAHAWKDSLMAACFLLGFAGLLDGRRDRRLAALVPLALGTAIRYNAFAAMVPLVVVLFEIAPWGALRRYALSLGVAAGITGGTIALNAALVDKPMHLWHSSLGPFDIAGVLAHLDETIPDAELEEIFAGSELRVHENIHARFRSLYTPKTFTKLVAEFEPLAPWHLPLWGTTPAPRAQRDAIERAWTYFATTYPVAYLRHRFAVMGYVLFLPYHHVSPSSTIVPREYPWPAVVVGNGFSSRSSTLQHALTATMRGLHRTTPLFSVWMYLAIAVLLLPLTFKHRDMFALLASGLLLEASLVALAPAPDYRYSHWLVVCAIVGAIVVFARRYRSTAQLASR